MNRKIRTCWGAFFAAFLLFLLPVPAAAFVLAASLEGTVGISMEKFAGDVLDRAAREEAAMVRGELGISTENSQIKLIL